MDKCCDRESCFDEKQPAEISEIKPYVTYIKSRCLNIDKICNFAIIQHIAVSI